MVQMNRLILTALVMFVGMTLSAQQKGDLYLSGLMSASAGKQIYQLDDEEEFGLDSQPTQASFGIGTELGLFVKDNVRLGFAFSMPFSSTPYDYEDGEWLKIKTIGFGFNPNISYYVKLTNNLYYTPEFGVSMEAGTIKEPLSSAEKHIDGYFGWHVYLSFLAFEFKVSDSFSLGAGVGSFGYASLKELQCDITTSQFSFSLNSASLSARFYLPNKK